MTSVANNVGERRSNGTRSPAARPARNSRPFDLPVHPSDSDQTSFPTRFLNSGMTGGSSSSRELDELRKLLS